MIELTIIFRENREKQNGRLVITDAGTCCFNDELNVITIATKITSEIEFLTVNWQLPARCRLHRQFYYNY